MATAAQLTAQLATLEGCAASLNFVAVPAIKEQWIELSEAPITPETAQSLKALQAFIDNWNVEGPKIRAAINATKALIAALPPDHPPPLEPAAYKSVQLGENSTNWYCADAHLYAKWKKPGGDWRDKDDVPNGLNAFAVAPIDQYMAQWVRWKVPALVTRLLTDNTGFCIHLPGNKTSPQARTREGIPSRVPPVPGIPPTLTVTTDKATYDCPCVIDTYIDAGAGALGHLYYMHTPLLVKFDLSAVRGTVLDAELAIYFTDFYSGSLPMSLRCDYLDMPVLITDPASQMGGVQPGIAGKVAKDQDLAQHPSVLCYDDLVSEAYIRSRYVVVNYALGGASFVPWPEYGLTAIRVASAKSPHLVDWHRWAQPLDSIPQPGAKWKRPYKAGESLGYDDLYCRYLMMIDPDVKLGMTELGMKLTGLDGSYLWSTSGAMTQPRPEDDGIFSYRLWHTPVSPANPDLYRMGFYAYDAQWSIRAHAGVGDVRLSDVCLQAGQKYSIELRVKANTFKAGAPQPDGRLMLWIDGVLAYDQPPFVNRLYPHAQIHDIPMVEIYHGGMGIPKATMHYEMAGIVIASEYIGPAKRLAA